MRRGVSRDYVAIGLVIVAILILATAATLPSTKTVTLTTTSAPSITTITSVVTNSTTIHSTYVTALTSTYTYTYPASPPLGYIQVSGQVTAAPYGNATAVVFAPNGSIPGYINSMFTGLVVDGKYNVSLPDGYSYGQGVDFQSPDGRDGTCWSGNIVDIGGNPDSPVTMNFACAPPSP